MIFKNRILNIIINNIDPIPIVECTEMNLDKKVEVVEEEKEEEEEAELLSIDREGNVSTCFALIFSSVHSRRHFVLA